MKFFGPILLLFTHLAIAQKRDVNYNAIDWKVAGIEANSVDELAQKLTANYNSDLEKTRAIFSWIAQHISYNYHPYRQRIINKRSMNTYPVDDSIDTSSILKPLNLIVAENVLKRRTAVCDGYARLFKCLCDDAGIRCEIINGYARTDFSRPGKNFRTNHSWNAVRLDSNWFLLDVTWASGYISYSTNDFVNYFDDQYFLTPPEQFVRDHFPDELQWTLLSQPPVLREFQHSPFKSGCFIKYDIISYWPSGGVIEAAVGDTINLQLQIDELAKTRRIGGGSLNDSSLWTPSPLAVFCKPMETVTGNTIHYTYIVESSSSQWLQLVYNDDMILRYKLNVKDKK